MTQTGTVLVHAGPGNLSSHDLVVVSLVLTHPLGRRQSLVIDHLRVAERATGVGSYDAIIGRDVLAHCLFTLDGPAGQFLLAY